MTKKNKTVRKLVARKETSDRVSRIAAKVMARAAKVGGGTRPSCIPCYLATATEIRALAASCLVQDTTKGKRRTTR